MTSMEEQQAVQTDAYVGLLDNFASDIGLTLEGLATEWTETDYDVQNLTRRSLPTDSSRTSSFVSQASMDSLDGVADWSLKKARPLAFANPVYDLVNIGKVVTQQRQMTLIPLSQFDINKPRDDVKKQKHHKRGSHGLMNKFRDFTIRKHSTKKHEPEMTVTAPLWTDVPMSYGGAVQRSMSLKKSQSEEETDAGEEKKEKVTRPLSLELVSEDIQQNTKLPPPKTPRTAKGNVSPFSPTNKEFPPQEQPENKTNTDSQSENSQAMEKLELPEKKTLQNADSNTSIASDVSEDAIEEGRTTKTMMEVMHEIEDDSASEDDVSQQKPENEEKEEALLLKRNKTLKWTGSRAAPALIREFTKKSKRAAGGPAKYPDTISADSPEMSAGESPAKTINGDIANITQPVALETYDSAKKTQVDKLQVDTPKVISSAPSTPKKRDSSAFTVLSSLLPPAPKLRRSESTKIRMYIHKMGTNSQNALGYATTEFVKQTLQSSEHRPLVLLHSIRSFMTDIKKYLITNPHVGFMGKILKIIKNLPITDAEGAIDDALERLVLYPLRDYIYKRLVIDYARSGKIKMVEDAIKLGQTKSAQELGIRSSLVPPNDEAMEVVRHHFIELQSTYSPYYKLKHLLSAVTTIYENTTDLSCDDRSARKIGADDFLPLLVHSIIKCDFAAAGIEAQYIDGLLDPTLLLGEGGYYLTTLISAVQVLSSMKKREAPLPNITDLQGFLKVGISSKTERVGESETKGGKESLLMHKTLHVPPSMTANSLGMMIAKKYGMKRTKEYCLHVVVNGIAYPLKPQEFPQLVKMDLLTQFHPNSFYFVYRKLDKSPEKVQERPVTIDSEHLKVNTEEGEEAKLPPDKKDALVEKSEPTSETSDESAEAQSPQKEEETLSDEVLPPPCDSPLQSLPSPGFDNIPLPDAVILEQGEQESPENLTNQSDASLLPPDATLISPDATFSLPDNTASPPGDATLPPPDATYLPADATPLPGDASLLPPDATVTLPVVTVPPPNATLSPIDATARPPDATGTPADATLLPADATVPPPHSNDMTPPPDTTVDSDVLPPPPDDVPLEPDGLPPPTIVLLSSPSLDKPSPSRTVDTSDTGTSSDEGETYLQATLVDDVLTPVKMKTNNPMDTGVVTSESDSPIVQSVVGEETELETPSKSTNGEITQEEIPQVKLTDLTVKDRPSSALSDVSNGSEGHRSIGCHSDGYHGSGSEGRHSGRGYYSDGHQVDDDRAPASPTDLGAHVTVTALKHYFEEEIDKVTKQVAKTSTGHSPIKN